MAQESEISSNDTQSFYDRIADVHNLAMKVNGYKDSVAKYLSSLEINLDSDSLVLDAGSGTGIVTLAFHAAGFRPKKTFALDLSHNSLKIAREQFEKDKNTDARNICVVQGNVLQLPFPDATFDLIITCGVLEYVSLEEGLEEFARVLKKGAKFVLIPIRPSLVGSVLEILYNFKTHSIEQTRQIAEQYFEIVGDYNFPITEPIGWSKMIFLLEKKRGGEKV
ncbi:MAG: class I SAM-dependent methyltransferase [Pyrinomonadaceae bacterium]|jgi:ubiquinone/menaquinone biosynthesis C-methylase UbiE|nr:class I SAM-dependent methyltransferase [Acidobacteriota bacterium]